MKKFNSSPMGTLAMLLLLFCLGTSTAGADGSHDETGGLAETWSRSLGAQMSASPVIAQVDGTGGKEIIVTTFCPDLACPGNPFGGGRVFVFDSLGNDLAGWPRLSNSAPFTGGAVVGDVDADGDLEIMAGSWNQAFLWNHDGTNYPGWPKSVGTFVLPALADLDSDGDLEIIYSSDDGILHVWHHDGAAFVGWPYVWAGGTGEGYILAPAVADLDGDGQLEIAAGTGQGPFTTVPHDFLTWELDGTVRPGFPVNTQPGVGAPAIGDLDGDGQPEIAFGDWRFQGQNLVFLLNAAGESLPGWPVVLVETTRSSVALGDLDGDGYRDVVIGGALLDEGFSCVNPRIYAVDYQGQALSGFPVDIPFSPFGFCPQNSPLILADIDGDGGLEVIAKYLDAVTAYHGDGSLVSGFPYPISDDGVGQDVAPGVAVDDVDRDGDVEFVFASASGRIAYFDTAAVTSPSSRAWPMRKHDPQATGSLGIKGIFSDGFETGDSSHWTNRVPGVAE